MQLDGKKVHTVLDIPKCVKCKNKAERIFLVGNKEYVPLCWRHAEPSIRMAEYKYLEEPLLKFVEELAEMFDYSDEDD